MLNLLLPSKFKPAVASDFIGPAGEVAAALEKMLARSRKCNNASMKILLNGPPGVGKSELSCWLQTMMGCNKWNTTKLNGSEIKLETVNDIAETLRHRNLFGDYRMCWFEECDQMTKGAQVRLLTMLDDLPDGVVVACTSNCQLKEFEPRFQSRFTVFELSAPTNPEIETFLRRWLPADLAQEIAKCARGNVRQALLDAEMALLS